jgi:alkylated DNA nucleotide flippase Atl1
MRKLHEVEKLPFAEIVVRNARRIPSGMVTTYGRLARSAGGGPMAAQSITSILGRAYDRGVTDIPFHRIVYADGRVWWDEGRKAERLALYAQEGIEVGENGRIRNLKRVLFEL